jgi:hypothetical protein
MYVYIYIIIYIYNYNIYIYIINLSFYLFVHSVSSPVTYCPLLSRTEMDSSEVSQKATSKRRNHRTRKKLHVGRHFSRNMEPVGQGDFNGLMGKLCG